MKNELEIIAELGMSTIITRRIVSAERDLVWDVLLATFQTAA